jgi:hypothetical protein
MKYDAFPAVAEVWAFSIPTVAFEAFRVGAALKRLHHLLTRNLRRIISPFVFVWLLQYVFLF